MQEALLRATEKLRLEVAHDVLTGLWNRAEVLDIVQRETTRHFRSGEELGIIVADVDHFKRINGK